MLFYVCPHYYVRAYDNVRAYNNVRACVSPYYSAAYTAGDNHCVCMCVCVSGQQLYNMIAAAAATVLGRFPVYFFFRKRFASARCVPFSKRGG